MLFGMGIALSGCGELPENELDLTASTKVYDGEAINVAAIAKDDADITIEFKSAIILKCSIKILAAKAIASSGVTEPLVVMFMINLS